MTKLLMLPVVENAQDTVSVDDIEVLLTELLGTDFEDTVVTDAGRVLYVAESTDCKVVSA